MYSIDYDPLTRIIHVKMSGVWTLATFGKFMTEAMMRGIAISRRDGPPSGLFDSRDLPLQSAIITKAMETAVAQANRISTAPSAVVASSPLAMMQAKRVMGSDHCRVFLDYDEAYAWLLAQRRAMAA